MSGHYIAKSDDLDKNYDELQAQVEAMRDQKPVAWVCINENGECEQIDFGAESPLPGDEGFVPLYLHPAPIPEEQIAEIKRLHTALTAAIKLIDNYAGHPPKKFYAEYLEAIRALED